MSWLYVGTEFEHKLRVLAAPASRTVTVTLARARVPLNIAGGGGGRGGVISMTEELEE